MTFEQKSESKEQAIWISEKHSKKRQQQGQRWEYTCGGNILAIFEEQQGGSCGVSGIIFLFTFRVDFLGPLKKSKSTYDFF